MHNILEIKSKIRNYTIEFTESIDDIIELTQQANTITFIDKNIPPLYPQLNIPGFICVECIEDIKNLHTTNSIFSVLSQARANINTKLIVIGGGILQDLVGFCASIYCRGIEYILVPTTLLSQVDSCVGGKTSLNFKDKKNILGSFYPPTKIIIYTKFTRTLSDLDVISGFGEVYKFCILQNKITKFDPDSSIKSMVIDGLKYKIDILDKDEFDKKERKFLNFGHTFGHAIESTSKYNVPHGIAVIIGCMISLTISKELGYNVNDYDVAIDKGTQLIRFSGIKFNKEWFDLTNLLEIIKSDKKNTGNIVMVLMDGDYPILHNIEDINIIKKSLNQIYESI
jgi:3-dehydroquinate synthase